jgi:outer membrane protein assembly factor BamA
MRLRWLLFFVMMPLLVSAQKRPAGNATGPWPVVSARAVGSQRFVERDILAAAGVTSGAMATPEELKQGADKLVASGAFEQVSYRYSPAPGGIKVEFNVADGAHFVHASFDNFVWFTDEQLMEAIHARVPLFGGELPAEGDMTEQVTDALQALLHERGIAGEIRFLLHEEQQDAPARGGYFFADGADIRVRDVSFPGATPAEVPALQAAANPLLKMVYRRSTAEAFASDKLRPVFLRRGFLKVNIGRPVATLVLSEPPPSVISLEIPVTPGPQYRLGALRWTGNKAILSVDLDKLLSVRVGTPADLVALNGDLEKVSDAYKTRGYLRQTTREVPTYDDSTQIVSYEVQVNEGDQYKFNELDIEGLDARLRDRVRDLWTLREGEPYDPNYIRVFLKSAASVLGPGMVTRMQQDINDQNKQVDITVHFDLQQPTK